MDTQQFEPLNFEGKPVDIEFGLAETNLPMALRRASQGWDWAGLEMGA